MKKNTTMTLNQPLTAFITCVHNTNFVDVVQCPCYLVSDYEGTHKEQVFFLLCDFSITCDRGKRYRRYFTVKFETHLYIYLYTYTTYRYTYIHACIRIRIYMCMYITCMCVHVWVMYVVRTSPYITYVI